MITKITPRLQISHFRKRFTMHLTLVTSIKMKELNEKDEKKNSVYGKKIYLHRSMLFTFLFFFHIMSIAELNKFRIISIWDKAKREIVMQLVRKNMRQKAKKPFRRF